jgi:hypothetical protein
MEKKGGKEHEGNKKHDVGGDMYVYCYVYVFLLYVYCYVYVFLLYVYVWLPWLRVFRAFSLIVRQMPG